MAVTCDMNASPSAPAHGATVTITYTVTGNDPVNPQSAQQQGRVVVGGQPYDVNTTITLPGTPAAQVTYGVPTDSAGLLTYQATADPAVFTAVVP